MLHANPFIGRIFVYELDPSLIYRFQGQVTFPPLTLIRMQVIDNLLVVHNLDEKASQLYDFKIADYTSALVGPNLDVDSSFVHEGAYCSDLIFPEEQENEQESAFKGLRGLTEQATSVFHASSGRPQSAAGGQPGAAEQRAADLTAQPMIGGPENSKEFVELQFKVSYTGDEDKPIQAQVDIPNGQSSAQKDAVAAASNSAKKQAAPKVDIYDEQNVIFVGPMFIVHRAIQRSLSLKVSLQSFLRHAQDPCKA